MQTNEWNKENPSDSQNPNNNSTAGLTRLLTMPSLNVGGVEIHDVAAVSKILTERFERHKKSTTDELQLAIIPEVENLTASISSALPGLCLSRTIEGIKHVMVVLFSNKEKTIATHNVSMGSNQQVGGFNNTISVKIAPTGYANKHLVEAVKNYFNSLTKKDFTDVVITSINVVDLEMYNHSEIHGDEERQRKIASYISTEWEQGFHVRLVKEASKHGIELPSPFKLVNGNPYGKHNVAEARVNVVRGRLNTAGYVSPANIEVVVSTTNPNNSNDFNNGMSAEVSRVYAHVGLTGVNFQNWLQMNNNMPQQFAGFNNGYRPLQPVITMEQAQPGENLHFNSGIMSTMFALFTLMSTNNNYVWAEPLRRADKVRGSLADLEHRINQMCENDGAVQQAIGLQNRPKLESNKVGDVQLVSEWLHNNVARHAVFQIALNQTTVDCAVTNFFTTLLNEVVYKDKQSVEVKTILNVLNALSKGKFGELCKENVASGKGWAPGKPILHRSNNLMLNGLTNHKNEDINLASFDEQMLCSIKGKNHAGMTNYLANLYGGGESANLSREARAHQLEVKLKEEMFASSNVHVHSVGTIAFWDPEFMSLLGDALSTIGTLNVTGSLGTYAPNNNIFALGQGLVTTATIGNNNAGGFGFGSANGVIPNFLA